jgi:ParB/RepB/Spo0J family partition protein
MSTETENSEAAEGATSAASEPQNPTVEVKAQESPRNVVEFVAEDKPSETSAESAQLVFNEAVRIISENVVYLPVDELKPHPLNEKIYGNDLTADFVDAVKRNGIYQPILVTADKLIISGHRRHAAAKQLKMLSLPTVIFHSTDELEIRAALVEANKQRVKTNEQIGREFNVLLEVEEARSRARMEGGKTVAQGEKGKSRDIVAKRIGDISGVSAERAGAVVEMIDKHIKAKHPKKAQQLQELLSKGITQAHKVAFEKSQNNGPKAGPEPKKPGKTTGASAATPSRASTSTLPISPETTTDSEQHDKALQSVYYAEAYLNHKSANKMNGDQKAQWKKVVEHMVALLHSLGVEVAVKK